MKQSQQGREPETIFQAAIESLNAFNALNDSASIPHVFDLDVKNSAVIANPSSRVKMAFQVSKKFLEAIFSGKFREQQAEKTQQVQQELLNAIVTVRKHHPVLNKWRFGSEEQQKSALFAQTVIEKANSILSQARKKPPSLKGRFIKFVYDQLGLSLGEILTNNPIELPAAIFMRKDSPKIGEKLLTDIKVSQTLKSPVSLAASQKISSVALSLNYNLKPTFAPTQNELDAFWMKAITLIKNHAIPVTSIRDALNFVKNTPIQTSVEHPEQSNGAIISLSQTLELFPGEEIELQGSFKRNALSPVLSVPIPDSFQLSSKSVQTGFPHAMQYHGVALHDKLIPSCPLRLDLLPRLQALSARKKKIAYELLPNGQLIGRAKELLNLKREAFESNKKFFLGAHLTLSKAIVKASEMNIEGIDAILENFSHYLRDHASPFDQLAKTSQLINEAFIVRPFEKLEEAWIHRKDPELGDPHLAKRAQRAEAILHEEVAAREKDLQQQQIAHPVLSYMLAMGKVVYRGVYPIILQQWSEMVEFVPPVLSDFSRLMQVWLYKQACTFHRELDGGSQWDAEQMKEHLMDLLQEDDVLFNTTDFDCLQDEGSAIVHELEDYYHLHFSTHTKLQAAKVAQK